MAMHVETPAASSTTTALTHISELTGAKVRVFLTEVAEGVSNYRSMHSLTQQVEHQYHGRFLIELLQNAHDAFTGPALNGDDNRVEIVFDPIDSAHGSLLVANDGAPFSASNFERLSQLGQSDKDPQKSIGNKGIGFRSVLEISDSPEIFSRSKPHSPAFDGYCFAFRPDVVRSLVEPITRLATGGPIPVWLITGAPIVDNWANELLTKFRRRTLHNPVGWLAGETRFLSPYLLPVPLTRPQGSRVADFESRGFATVVRLPLKSADLRDYVLERMSQLSSATVLFLDQIGTLRIVADNDVDRCFTRVATALEKGLGGTRVAIVDGGEAHEEYWVWSKALHVADAPDGFRKAVAALPGRWPDITDITVSVAARIGEAPQSGRFSIYLPTLVTTGSAVHVNAPFFGDMSRTSISFADAYNRHLLETAADLSLEVVRQKLANKGETEARAIVDFLAPVGNGAASDQWTQQIEGAEKRAAASLDEEALVLAEEGWGPLNLTSLIPPSPKATLLTEEVLRRHATFRIFHRCLESRSTQIRALANKRFETIGAYPLLSELAQTIAAVAADLHANGGDWNAFWRDVIVLLPTGQAEIAKHAVLLGVDGALHRPDERTRVFFVPRQGTQDDSDNIGGEGATIGVPPTLQASVAFLHEQIQLYDPSRPTVQTAVRVYLGQGLVSQFRVETIFSEVLQQLTPPLPAPIDGKDADLCRDILGWAMRLMANVVARGRGTEAMLRLLRTIPVPCEGGWFAMRDASFSRDWPATVGAVLVAYLRNVKTDATRQARKRLLLAPGHAAWGGVSASKAPVLMSGGVIDGLRLIETKSSTWPSAFRASYGDFCLPGPPPAVASTHWPQYIALTRLEAKPPFSTPQLYQVGSLYTFPGLAEFDTLSDEARLALSELIMRSLPGWGSGLQKLAVSKQGGQSSRLEVTSPLTYYLRSVPWLAIREPKGVVWARPSDRWYVPADTLAGRARHYAHLRALPATLARNVGQTPALASALRALGMQFFDPQATTADPGLLIALTAVVGSDEVSDANVLLGQVRDAWRLFRPQAGQAALAQLAVRRRDRQFASFAPTTESPAYLPDSAAYTAELEAFDFPVVAIGTGDARELRDWFIAAYGTRVQPTSTLSLVPHVNGAAWTGLGSALLSDGDLGWLVRPLLVMVAQGRGVLSSAFKDRHETLRSARIDWVPRLSVAVMRGAVKLTDAPVPALWEPARKTLVVAEHCRTHLEDLAGALAQALERDDLELPLRYVLHAVDSVYSAPEDLAVFLAPVRITSEQIHHVLEHLRGDVGHVSRFVGVLLAVIVPETDTTALQSAGTEEELSVSLTAMAIPGLDVHRSLQIARESVDLSDFGRTISPDFGEAASLARWNEAMARFGLSSLSNRNWALQFEAGLEEAAALVKRALAHALRQGAELNYAQMCGLYQSLATTVDLSGSHWNVGFSDVMQSIADWAESWPIGARVLDAIRQADTLEGLRAALSDAGVQLDGDPDECGRKNDALVDTVARGLDRLRLASWIKAGPIAGQPEWTAMLDAYRACATTALAGQGFTREWSESEVLALFKEGVTHADFPVFQAALDACGDLASLHASLGVTDGDLNGAQAGLDARRADRIRRRGIVKVCGEDFDGSEDNLEQLWSFLSTRISDLDLAATMALNLSKPTALSAFKRGSRTRGTTSSSPWRRPQRASKGLEDLIGLAGEIHVYRMLRQQYGEDAVPSSAWISENSQRVFRFNQTDDARGCDFAFTVKGRQYRVEVKASAGDDEIFTMGSSEIRLAMDIRTRGKRRREVFVMVHVKNALSQHPTAVVLPNPYDPKHVGTFNIEEAGARVRYQVRD
ncbi:MAG: hypothetical protein ABI433_07015 [Burkholderiaceae bacterium]